MATIGVEIDVCLDTIITNVEETEIPEFDNKDQDTLGAGCEFVEGMGIYQNTGDAIVIPTYVAEDDYVVGDLVYTGDGEDPEVDRVHEIIGLTGWYPKQPESYSPDIDDSLNHEDWEHRYMKFKDIPSGGSLHGISLNAPQDHSGGVTFKPDGSKVFIAGSTTGLQGDIISVYQYSLGENWKLDSVTSSTSLKTGLHGVPRGIAFSTDGLKMYELTSGTLYQWTLGTVWNVSTATYDGISKTMQTSSSSDIFFKPDGSKFYISSEDGIIHEWDISSGNEWNIYYATYNSNYKNTEGTTPVGFFIDSTGTKLYEACRGTATIYYYTLGTAWEIDSATYNSVSATTKTYISSIFFSSDGDKVYELDDHNDKLYQSMLVTPWDIETFFYSAFPAIRSEVRGDYEYIYKIEANGGTYTFTTYKCVYPEAGVPCLNDDWSPMTVHSYLDYESDEPKPYIGSWTGSWVAKTLIIRPDGLYIRTTTSASVELEELTAYQLSVLTLISTVNGFNLVRYANPYRPFDNANITPAIYSSPMTYTVQSKGVFNSFTLAKILASSVDYIFRLPIDDDNYVLWLDGVEVGSGGNGIVKMDTVAIDCRRDCDSILALYPTTTILYADYQMPIGSTVEVIITHSDEISLGDFTFNNSLVGGFTNMEFTHSLQDFNDYTPDPWGNIPQGVKAVVTKFNITVDIYLEHYDHCVALNESIAGKYVTIDASDSQGEASDSLNVFASLIRRVRITSATSKSIVKDGELWRMAGFNISVQEIV